MDYEKQRTSSMKEVTFNEKVYQIPESWSEVSLGMVIKTSEYDELIEDAPIVSIICGYCGIQSSELKASRMAEVRPILDVLDFIYTQYVAIPSNSFEFKGYKYSTKDSLEETEFQEWVSTQTLLYQYKNNPVAALPKLIAITCKRPGETLDEINIEERSKEFYDLPFTIAKDVEGFF